jgi:hypothetical protein
LLAIAALALILNLAGLTWGLPARWHPDEKADVVLGMARGADLGPESFINPSLPLYAMLPLVYAQLRLASVGVLRGLGADPLIVGRGLSALAGAAAVLAWGLAVRRHAPHLGLLPPALLALSPGAVNLCHFATPEAWLLLGTALTLWLALERVEGRAPVWALGLAVGLTASTKYTAAALLLPALLAVVASPERAAATRDRVVLLAAGLMAIALGSLLLGCPGAALASHLHLKDARLLRSEQALAFLRALGIGLALAGASLLLLGLCARQAWAQAIGRAEVVVLGLAAGAGFLIGTPYSAIRPLAFLSDLAFNDQTRSEYKGLAGAGTSFGPYLSLLGEALTTPVVVATLVGLVLAALGARRGRMKPLVVALGAVAPYLLVAASGHQAMRFLVPAWPSAVWLAASSLTALPRPPLRRLLATTVLVRTAIAALLVVRLFFVDSRRLATTWMEFHVPPGATVDLIANHEGYAPTLPEGRTLRLVPTLSREMAPVDRFVEAARLYPAEASPWLILSASFYERFLDHADQQPERAEFFRGLLSGQGGFRVVARFQQRGWLRPRAEFLDPEIVILARDEAASARPK